MGREGAVGGNEGHGVEERGGKKDTGKAKGDEGSGGDVVWRGKGK